MTTLQLHAVPSTDDLHHASKAGQQTTVLDVLELMCADIDDPSAASRYAAPMRRLRAGDTLFLEGTRADAIYFVRAGTFKMTNTAEDGYEQVLGFAGRREVLGFDALCMGQHPSSAVALEDASVYAIAMRDVFPLAQSVPALDRVLHLAASQGLRYRSQQADVMAAVAAEVRLARFLVQWSQRMVAAGQSPTRFHLRMGRRDIASHLGVAHETVSRSFSALVSWGWLSVANRDVEILRLDELKSFARSTRRPSDDAGAFAHGFVPMNRATAHGGHAAQAHRPHELFHAAPAAA